MVLGTISTGIYGQGAMTTLIRTKDWSSTPLGPLERWSELLRGAVNMVLAVPTPMQLFWGPDLTTIYNDAMEPFLAGKHPDALGSPARQVWSEAWSAIGQQMEAVMRDGVSCSYLNLPLQLLQNGVLEDMHWSFTYSPVYDAEGNVVGLLNVTQNTTEAFRAQAALAASEQRFRRLVNNASVGIALGSTTGELTYLNPSLLNTLHYTPEEVAHGEVRWDKLTPERYADLDAIAIQQLRTTGIAEPYEKAYYTREGEAVPLLIGASVIPSDEYSGASEVAVFATDLRKQKRAESALLQSEKLAAVGKLAASISHEINNPLEAVTNLLYIVRQDENLATSSKDFLETADRELARVSQITSQTLRFHRQSTAPLTIHPDALVDEVLQLYNARLTNSAIEVHRDYDRNAALTCYEGDIRQVLNNLVGNAVDAMRNGVGRQLRVRTRRATRGSTGAEGVLITIADEGPGMSCEVRKRIFDAFYTTKGIHGTGLGLWISYRIVHKHRGYIRVHSSTDPRHHGTVFQLWLPVQLAKTARDSWYSEGVTVSQAEFR